MGQRKKGKKTSAALNKNFSPSQPAGQPVQGCPLAKPVPVKPCNLAMLSFTEPAAEMGETKGTRSVQIRQGQSLDRSQSPTLLPPGGAFQITAKSTANPPNLVNVVVQMQDTCSLATHPQLSANGPQGSTSKITKKQTLGFNRPSMPGDDGEIGLWAVINAVFGQSPQTCSVTADCCGLPAQPGGGSVASLNGNIQIFPADQYELELTVPAFLKPDSLKFETTTSGWDTEADEDESEEYFESNQTFLQSPNATRPVRQFATDMQNKQTGSDDDDFVDELEVELTQTDGVRSLKAPIDDIIKLVRMIRSAEYAMKQLDGWIDALQVGPGVSFSIECQFFAGKLTANWGYTEYTDDRAFLQYSGSLQIQIVKASINLSLGVKFAGMADLLLVLSGDGAISISIPSVKKESPDDERPDVSVTPEGELELSGSIEGTLMWFVKGSVGIETTFEAETENLTVLTDTAMLSGEIKISREAVNVTASASCRLLGTSGYEMEVIKADPQVAVFTFPPP
jgi:hypothetical protein